MASIRPYKSNKFRAVIRRTGYKTQSAIFDSRAEAGKWARGIERQMDKRTFVDASRHDAESVADLFKKFRDEVCPTRAGEVWEKRRINFFLEDCEWMQRRIPQLQPSDIRDWRNTRLESVDGTTVNRDMNLLSSVFTHAIREWSYVMPHGNPVGQVARPKGASSKHRNRRWEDREIVTMVEKSGANLAVQPKGLQWIGFALLLAIETAMRRGELCLFTVGDVHFEERYVHLAKTKNGDKRNVPLSRKAMELLEVLVQGRAADEQVFPFSPDTLGRYYREVRKEAGLADADINLHDARHEAASRLSLKLANVLELSAVTGHRSLQTLKRYYHPKASVLASKLD